MPGQKTEQTPTLQQLAALAQAGDSTKVSAFITTLSHQEAMEVADQLSALLSVVDSVDGILAKTIAAPAEPPTPTATETAPAEPTKPPVDLVEVNLSHAKLAKSLPPPVVLTQNDQDYWKSHGYDLGHTLVMAQHIAAKASQWKAHQYKVGLIKKITENQSLIPPLRKTLIGRIEALFKEGVPGYAAWLQHRADLKKVNKAKHKTLAKFQTKAEAIDVAAVAQEEQAKQAAVADAVEKLGIPPAPPPTDASAEPEVPKAIQDHAKKQAGLMIENGIPDEPSVKDELTTTIDGLQLKLGDTPVARITTSLYDWFVTHADGDIKPVRESAGMLYIRMVEIRNLIGMKIRTAINQGAYWRAQPNVLIAKHQDGTYTMLTTDDL